MSDAKGDGKKRITIGTRPTKTPQQPDSADEWVDNRITEPEKMKRLTIDIPENLHRAIKMQCASRGTKIADELREILTNRYLNK